ILPAPFDVMKVQAEAAPPIPRTESEPRLAGGWLGRNSPKGSPAPCKPGFARGQWRRLAEPLQLKAEGSASGRDLAGRAGHFGITPATTQRSTHPSADRGGD